MNNVCTLARAPGGQMQGATTQAMRCHRRGAETQQMPARRPAGVVARSLNTTRYARRSRLASGPGDQQQNVTFIHLQALSRQKLRTKDLTISIGECGAGSVVFLPPSLQQIHVRRPRLVASSRQFQIVSQHRLEMGMRAFVDDIFGSAPRGPYLSI